MVSGLTTRRSNAISFRRLEPGDFPLLVRWLTEPHVSRWWGVARDLAKLEEDYGPAIDGNDPTEMFIAELDARPIGLIQRYRNRDHPDWDRQIQLPRAAGIDYLIGEPDLVGHGVGPRMIARFAERLFGDYPDIETVAVGVLQANRQSWRALEKAGFRRLRTQFLESEEAHDRGPGYIYIWSRSASEPGPATTA